MTERHYGEKYEQFHRGPDGQRVYRKASEYSAQIRKDIKDAVKAGTLPKANYRVTCKNFSGGCSVDVEVQDLPGAWVERYSETAAPTFGFVREGQKVLSVEASRVRSEVSKIHGAYNYDGSDAMTDYYDVNYYGIVEIESEWSAEWRAREKARKAG